MIMYHSDKKVTNTRSEPDTVVSPVNIAWGTRADI